MTDYLNNLIEKNFKMAEIIKPRPISIFEPFPKENQPRHEHPWMQGTQECKLIPGKEASLTLPSFTQETVIPLSEGGKPVILNLPSLRNYQWTNTSFTEDMSHGKQEQQEVLVDPVSMKTAQKNSQRSFIKTKNQKPLHTDRFFSKHHKSNSEGVVPHIKNYQVHEDSINENMVSGKSEEQKITSDPASLNSTQKNPQPPLIRSKKQKLPHTDRFFSKNTKSKSDKVRPNLKVYQWTDASFTKDANPGMPQDQRIPSDTFSVKTGEKDSQPPFIKTKNQKSPNTDRFFSKSNKSKSESLSPQSTFVHSQSISCEMTRRSDQTMEDRESLLANVSQGRLSESKLRPKFFNQTKVKGVMTQTNPPAGNDAGIFVKRDTVSPSWQSHKSSEQITQSQSELVYNNQHGTATTHTKLNTVTLQPEVVPLYEHTMPVIKGQEAPKESSPTIEVTIGRIEVRAMSQPTPIAKEKRPQPTVMSLDEYLRQRTRGGN